MNHLNFEVSPSIKLILEQELALGNTIIETNEGWPKEKSTFILLKNPFHKKYSLLNLKFRELNDPHYWKEEYQDEDNLQTIACRF